MQILLGPASFAYNRWERESGTWKWWRFRLPDKSELTLFSVVGTWFDTQARRNCPSTVPNAVKHFLLAVLALATVLLALVSTVASAKTANCSCLLWFKMLHSVALSRYPKIIHVKVGRKWKIDHANDFGGSGDKSGR